MGLSLVVGPAHAGKVALLLERYLDVLDRDPWLIVPNRGDVERVERDLLRRRPALLAGRIGTFDDVFEQIAFGDRERRPVASGTLADARRPTSDRDDELSTRSATPRRRRASPTCSWMRSGSSNRRSSISTPSAAISAELARAYRAELARLGALGSRRPPAARGRTDPERSRRLGSRAGLRVRLRGPDGCGVGADRGPRRADGRHRVDPVRARTCGLRRARAHGRRSRSSGGGRGEELPPAERRPVPLALVHLERELFGDGPALEPPLEGSVAVPRGSRRARHRGARRRGAARADS